MLIEANKYYKTRSGNKAYVVSTENPFGDLSQYPILGYIKNKLQATWNTDGKYILDIDHEYDLVEEWKDPITFDVYLYKNSMGYFTSSTYDKRCILVAKTTITEGQGLE